MHWPKSCMLSKKFHLYFSAGTNCMTSRSSSYDATALASYQAALAGQLYPPDTQCENIQGTGSYMDRVRKPNGTTHNSWYYIAKASRGYYKNLS